MHKQERRCYKETASNEEMSLQVLTMLLGKIECLRMFLIFDQSGASSQANRDKVINYSRYETYLREDDEGVVISTLCVDYFSDNVHPHLCCTLQQISINSTLARSHTFSLTILKEHNSNATRTVTINTNNSSNAAHAITITIIAITPSQTLGSWL